MQPTTATTPPTLTTATLPPPTTATTAAATTIEIDDAGLFPTEESDGKINAGSRTHKNINE